LKRSTGARGFPTTSPLHFVISLLSHGYRRARSFVQKSCADEMHSHHDTPLDMDAFSRAVARRAARLVHYRQAARSIGR
jgi:hypothetical protein